MSEALQKALELLVMGWGGVFIVILIIYLASIVLSKLFPVKH
ncbi:MAG: OadG-related small transporter subunit [Enterococcus hulanensis]